MTSVTTAITASALPARGTDWVAVAGELAPGFAARAAGHDANDSFPVENYRELKERQVLSAAIPAELGGGGASFPELCAMLRELGRACGATALALSMHTHLVATMVWRWRQGAPVAPQLERLAAEQLVLVTTSASDWLVSNGSAERVDGGFRVSARKSFASGSPMGDLLITSVQYDDPGDGPTVLHFSVPTRAAGITVLDTWRTMGMRASGSNDLVLDGVFVPDAAVSLRRPRGAWVPMYNAVTAIAAPLILSVYLGVAEAARDVTIQLVSAKRDDPDVWYQMGELETALVTGRLAVQGMIDVNADYTFAPVIATANDILTRKTIASESLLRAGETALAATGGRGIFRSAGLERLVRDLHAVQFHPLPAIRQHRFTGRIVLGLDPVG